MTMHRRAFLASTALAAFPLTSQLRADWKPSQRYPDSRVRIIDESFSEGPPGHRRSKTHRHGDAVE